MKNPDAVIFLLSAIGGLFGGSNFDRGMRWWGWWSGASIGGGLAVIYLGLSGGNFGLVAVGVLGVVVGWFSLIRHWWAWWLLTALSFNPIAWIINGIYGYNRRAKGKYGHLHKQQTKAEREYRQQQAANEFDAKRHG